MLKKMSLRKISIASLALFSMALIYMMPGNKNLEYSIRDYDIEYVYNNDKAVIYLLDSNDYVARTTIDGSSKDKSIEAKYLLEALIVDSSKNGDIPNGFRSIIPAGTEVLDVRLEDKTLIINFSSEILGINEKYEEKMIETIIYTLTSIDGIDNVIIKVEGKELTELPNSKKSLPKVLNRKYGVNKTYDIIDVHNIDFYTVYYVSSYNNNEYYVPVTKYINNNKNDKVKVIIDELSSSPIHEDNLMSYLDANTSLINYEEKNNIFKLNFNDALLDNKSDNKILEEVIYTISLSLMDNYDNIKDISFMVNGKEICKNSLKSIE